MGLFDPVWMTKNSGQREKAVAAVRKVGDSQKLKEIALQAPLREVRLAAAEQISDQAVLEELYDRVGPGAAILPIIVKKIESQAFLRKIVLDERMKHSDAPKLAYARRIAPSFEENFQMTGLQAAQNLMADVRAMRYPEDRERLLLIARACEIWEPVTEAVKKLPYPQEAAELKALICSSRPETAKQAALDKLPVPLERAFLIDEVLRNPDASASLKKKAARRLPDTEAALEERICPFCGTLGGVSWSAEETDGAYLHGYRCTVCGHRSAMDWSSAEDKTKDFSVPLRQFRER